MRGLTHLGSTISCGSFLVGRHGFGRSKVTLSRHFSGKRSLRAGHEAPAPLVLFFWPKECMMHDANTLVDADYLSASTTRSHNGNGHGGNGQMTREVLPSAPASRAQFTPQTTPMKI